ncbi:MULTISPECIES: shikimate kinase [unclassified Arthrobacter]|uniref:shikimate kinase n=1 Tax=unclassified Arthrobacter TaxID=235627 RepID=UPI001DD4EE27|nr:shikimate kinase [Arthrobacter sp. Bi26]CAH0240758.1 Shikimate kinase [Arthrobacter sp. Bi26]
MPAGNTGGLSAAATHIGPVVLIGPMAVGKSAIGQQLAQHLGCAFVDTDALVVAQHGTIAEIFASRGEHAFRELEARAVAQAIEEALGSTTVISLGGGAVLDSGTQQLLGRCTVVYLECDAQTVAERIARNSGRPLLAGDAMGRWRTLFATRRPVYERLADLVLDVRTGSVPELAHRLEDALGEHTVSKTAAVPTPAATKEVE